MQSGKTRPHSQSALTELTSGRGEDRGRGIMFLNEIFQGQQICPGRRKISRAAVSDSLDQRSADRM